MLSLPRRAALAFALVGLVVVAAPVVAGAAPSLLAPEQPNPAFAQALRNRATSGSDRLPNPVRMYVGAATVARLAAQAGSLPAQYDLRSLGLLTAIRDQGDLGTCWSFGNMGALESHLLTVNPADVQDFSEDNLVQQSGFGPFSWSPTSLYNAGGWDAMAVAYFARWAGPLNETDDPYPTPDTSPPVVTVQRHVQDVIMLPGRRGVLRNSLIKKLLTQYGAVGVGMHYDTSAYKFATAAYYYPGIGAENHGVDIVGWNDSYPRRSFARGLRPPGNGAFLVRNSWGAGYGDGGYFWVSYYDLSFAFGDTTVYTNVEAPTNYSGIYQYDDLGLVMSTGFKRAKNPAKAWFANQFTAVTTGSIGAVGFYATGAKATYTVYAGPTLSSLTPRAGGTLPLPGYHTVHLDTPLAVTAGAPFVVAVRITTPGTRPLPIERPKQDYSSMATALPGQSFVRPGTGRWYDLTTQPGMKQANVCLKAFAL